MFFLPDHWLHHKDLSEIETIQAFGKIEENATPVAAAIDSGMVSMEIIEFCIKSNFSS